MVLDKTSVLSKKIYSLDLTAYVWSQKVVHVEEDGSLFYAPLSYGVTGLIPGTSTNFKCGLGLKRGPLSLVRTIG